MTLANEQRRKAQRELDSEIGVADAAGIVALLFHGVLRRSDVGALCWAPTRSRESRVHRRNRGHAARYR